MFNLFLDFSVAVIKLYLSSDNEYYDLGLQKKIIIISPFLIFIIFIVCIVHIA